MTSAYTLPCAKLRCHLLPVLALMGCMTTPTPRLAADAHHQQVVQMTTTAVAARLPATLGRAAALAWRADRRAVLVVLGGQALAAVAAAIGLLAVSGALGHLLQDGPASERARAAAPALAAIVVVLLVRYAADAAARLAAARVAPVCVREADLAVLAAATSMELAAYENPGIDDALEAAGDGAQAMTELVEDAQATLAALAQIAAAATILTALHPVLIPLLVAAALPRAVAAVGAARTEHAATHRTLSDRRLRGTLRGYITDRNTGAEVRTNLMADFLTSRYRDISLRLENEALAAVRPERTGPCRRRPRGGRSAARCLGHTRRSRRDRPPRPGGGRLSGSRPAPGQRHAHSCHAHRRPAVPHQPVPGRLVPLHRPGQPARHPPGHHRHP